VEETTQLDGAVVPRKLGRSDMSQWTFSWYLVIITTAKYATANLLATSLLAKLCKSLFFPHLASRWLVCASDLPCCRFTSFRSQGRKGQTTVLHTQPARNLRVTTCKRRGKRVRERRQRYNTPGCYNLHQYSGQAGLGRVESPSMETGAQPGLHD
jgi:hypothetical protein